jgi:hypothetical protein
MSAAVRSRSCTPSERAPEPTDDRETGWTMTSPAAVRRSELSAWARREGCGILKRCGRFRCTDTRPVGATG